MATVEKKRITNEQEYLEYLYETRREQEGPTLTPEPRYIECKDLMGNTWYRDLLEDKDLPIGHIPIEMIDNENSDEFSKRR